MNITGDAEVQALTHAFNRINSAATSMATGTYNGKTMTIAQTEGLKALLDEFRFVVDSQGGHPEITPVVEFGKLPISTNRPQLNPRAGFVCFHGPLMYKYQFGEYSAELPLIVVGQALIDMKKKVSSNGTPVSRYGTGWINVGIPTAAFKSICEAITEATGYEIDDSNFSLTADDLYVTTVASINEIKNPEMSMIQEGTSDDEAFIKYDLGSVGEAYTREDLNDVGVGFIAFSLGLNCELPVGTDVVPDDIRTKPYIGCSMGWW